MIHTIMIEFRAGSSTLHQNVSDEYMKKLLTLAILNPEDIEQVIVYKDGKVERCILFTSQKVDYWTYEGGGD